MAHALTCLAIKAQRGHTVSFKLVILPSSTLSSIESRFAFHPSIPRDWFLFVTTTHEHAFL